MNDTDEKVTFTQGSQLLMALIIVIGTGFMLWHEKITAEMAWSVVGVVIVFYFGNGTASQVARTSGRAAADAVTRSLEERGIR
jgi:type IV secretory pathway VirB2 component (pilin)